MRIIKKYTNRRLYDTTRSLYVNLEDLKALVLANIEFQVVDAKTERDITHVILLQILVEQSEKSPSFFNADFLVQLIRFSDNTMQDMVGMCTAQQDFIKEAMGGKIDPVVLHDVSKLAYQQLQSWQAVQQQLQENWKNYTKKPMF